MNKEYPNADVKQQAMEWHTTISSGNICGKTLTAFEGWLQSSPAHKQAYFEIEQVWRDLDAVISEGDLDVEFIRSQDNKARWSFAELGASLKPVLQSLGVVAGAVSFVLAATIGIGHILQPHQADIVTQREHPQHATLTAEIRDVMLEDGSVVTLGAQSIIETHFTEESRRVTLVSGEVFFNIAKDPMRPFYVAVDDTLIRVVGTQFDVKKSGENVHVSVLEGIVDVIKADEIPEELALTAPPASDAKRLMAGQKIVATEKSILPEKSAVQSVVPGHWREGRLAYEDASLYEIIQDVNRYSSRDIIIKNDKVGKMRFTLAFRSDEITTWLTLLERTQPIKVDDDGVGEIILRSTQR